MAVLGVYQHTKARVGLHPPSVTHVPALHVKVHASILDLLVPSPLLTTLQLTDFPPQTPNSSFNLAVSAMHSPALLCSLSPSLSLCSASPSLMIRLGPVRWPCSVYFFLCSVLFQVLLALPSLGSTIRNSPLSHTMGRQSYHQSTLRPDGPKKHTDSVQ